VATTTLMSFADFERLDAGADHIELLKGELIRLPPAKLRHNEVAERLYRMLIAAIERLRAEQPGIAIGQVHHEMGYCLGRNPGTWLQPDVSVTHPGQASDDYYCGAPLLVFEIVSASDTAAALDEKVSEYLAHGAGEVWLIYPNQRHAWVYAPSAAAARHETRSIQSDLLPGIHIPFEQVF